MLFQLESVPLPFQGLSLQKTEEWMSQLPNDKVPRLDTTGEKYRDQQLVYQLPKQDLSLKYCNHIERNHHSAFQDFIHARNEIALDVGHAIETSCAADKTMKSGIGSISSSCANCDKQITSSSLAVMATRFGFQTFWHPACFTCATCNELLVRE